MKKNNKKLLPVLTIVFVMSILFFSGCSDDNNGSSKDATVSEPAITSAAAAADEKPSEGAINDSKDKDKKEDNVSENIGSESPPKKSTKTSKQKNDKKKDTKKPPSGKKITVKSNGKTNTYALSEIKDMGTVSYRYSYRNKDSDSRQFDTWTGVKLTTLLNRADVSGSTVRMISNDGYTKEYSLSDLKSTKYAFKKKTGNKSDTVPTIIATSGEGYYRLCFGQNKDDSDDNGDYNMQYWAKWIVTIEVY